MYPTIGHFDASINPLHSPYPEDDITETSSSSQQPRPAANGPPPSPAFPTLQVTIDQRFQITPPVRAPSQPPGQGGPAAGSAAPPPPPSHPGPGSREALDLAMERRLLQELAPGGNANGPSSSSANDMQLGEVSPRADPYSVLLGRYTGMGYSRDEVAMALVIVGPDNSDDADKIVDACRKYKKLRSMEFRSDHVVGALVMHNGDLDAATNSCIDASS